MSESVTLYAMPSGKFIDDDGNYWCQETVDAFARDCDCDGDECDEANCPRLAEDCPECGDRVQDYWLCLDGGDVLCDAHVNVIPYGQPLLTEEILLNKRLPKHSAR